MRKADKQETAVAVRESGALIHPQWNDEEKALIRDTVAPGLSDIEFRFFLYYAAALHLNPMAKEIYAIKYGNKLVPQVAIDGFLKHAQGTGKFRGFTEPEITVRDASGDVKIVPQKLYDPDNHKIVAASIGINHADDPGPTVVTCTAKEYAVYFGEKLSERWKKAPAAQLVKCCKALAIRSRFPGMGGAYIEEEMTSEDAARKTITLEPTSGRQSWAPKEELQAAAFGFSPERDDEPPDRPNGVCEEQINANRLQGENYNPEHHTKPPTSEVEDTDRQSLVSLLMKSLVEKGVKQKARQDEAIAAMCKAVGADHVQAIKTLDQVNAAQDWVSDTWG